MIRPKPDNLNFLKREFILTKIVTLKCELMKVSVQTPHFVADQKLINFIQKKMDKLEQFYDHIIYADVFLRLENTSDRQNKIVEILLSVPGNELIVKKQAKSFEEGADSCAQSLERLLVKRKQKIRASA